MKKETTTKMGVALKAASKSVITRVQENFARTILSLMFISSLPKEKEEGKVDAELREIAVKTLEALMSSKPLASSFEHLETTGLTENGQLTKRGMSLAISGFNSRIGSQQYTKLNFEELCKAQAPAAKLGLLAAWYADFTNWRKDHPFTPQGKTAELFQSVSDFLYEEIPGEEVEEPGE